MMRSIFIFSRLAARNYSNVTDLMHSFHVGGRKSLLSKSWPALESSKFVSDYKEVDITLIYVIKQ